MAGFENRVQLSLTDDDDGCSCRLCAMFYGHLRISIEQSNFTYLYTLLKAKYRALEFKIKRRTATRVFFLEFRGQFKVILFSLQSRVGFYSRIYGQEINIIPPAACSMLLYTMLQEHGKRQG